MQWIGTHIFLADADCVILVGKLAGRVDASGFEEEVERLEYTHASGEVLQASRRRCPNETGHEKGDQ